MGRCIYVKSLLLLCLSQGIASCSFKVAKDVKLVSFDANIKSGKKIGPVQGESCGVRVLGFGSNPSFIQALNQLKSQHNLRYINSLRIDSTYNDYFVWSKSCWQLSGEGYQ